MAGMDGQELTDERWERIKKHLPPRRRSPRGGRPRADDRACLEGVLWVLRTGARWKDLPRDRGFPSPATCWRRLSDWEEDGVWLRLWTALLDELDEREKLDWSECFADATFAPAKKGANASGPPKRARERSSWWWSTARAFLWHAPCIRPVRRKRK